MKFRSLLISIIALLLVLLPAATSAQDFDVCFGLAAADCEELNAASQNLAVFAMSSESFTVEFDIVSNVTGLPEESAGASTGTFNANGAIDLVLSGNGAIPITLGAAMSAEFGMGEMLTTLPVELRLVDDYVYFLNPMVGTWQGANLAESMSDPAFAEQLESMNPLSEDSPMAESMPDMESLMALTTLLDLPGLITYVREGNDFIFTVDVTALGQLSSPEHAEKLAALTALLNESEPGSGDQLVGTLQMLPMVLNTGTITMVQSINPELNIIDKITFDIVANINGEMMTGSAEPIDAVFSFEMRVTNVDAAPSAVAPAEFEEVAPAELLSGF